MKRSILILLISLSGISLFSQTTFESGTWGDSIMYYNEDPSPFWSLGKIIDPYAPPEKSTYCALVHKPIGESIDTYSFGIVSDYSDILVGDIPSSPIAYDLSGKNGEDEIITLNFSSVENLDYIAYCGDELLEYEYDGSSLLIAFKPTTAVKSASNDSANLVLFGFVLVCNENPTYGASVFRTNMFWNDIALQKTGGGYGDNTVLPGANFNGTDGENVDFDYYVTQSILENLDLFPVSDLDKCEFTFTKSDGTNINPNKTVKYYTTDGQPTIWGGNVTPVTSSFKFGAVTTTNYVNVHAENDRWSDANVCLCGQIATSIQDNSDANNIKTYTHHGTIYIESNQAISSNAEIFNLSGQLIKRVNISGNTPTIDINKKGVFILKIGDKYTSKIML